MSVKVRYSIEGALPVVGDVGFRFRRFLEDPFVALIRSNLPHQPARINRSIKLKSQKERKIKEQKRKWEPNHPPPSFLQTDNNKKPEDREEPKGRWMKQQQQHPVATLNAPLFVEKIINGHHLPNTHPSP